MLKILEKPPLIRGKRGVSLEKLELVIDVYLVNAAADSVNPEVEPTEVTNGQTEEG